MKVIGLGSQVALAKSIARKLSCKFSIAEITQFPDGEAKIRILSDVRNEVAVVVKSLYPANDAVIEIILAASACRAAGAKKVVLVCPYMAYMRQDKSFHPHEAVSARIIAKLLSLYGDAIITIDPHLHRIKHLQQIFSMKAVTLSAMPLIEEYINKRIKNAVIIGPDSESSQWDMQVAKICHLPFTILKKQRQSSYNVKIKFDDTLQVKGKNVILIDDIVSSGRTLLKTIKHLKKFSPKGIYCFCTHGIFAGDAAAKLLKTGAKLISTNTIPSRFTRLDVAETLAKRLMKNI